MTIIWSEFARTNLQEIYNRISEYSPNRAELYISDLVKAPEILTAHPQIGHVIPDANNLKIREIIARDYRICYILRNNGVYITAVLHSRQDIANMTIKPWQH